MSNAISFVPSRLSRGTRSHNYFKDNFYLLYIMLVSRYYYGYSNKKKQVTGKGCVDSLSSIFNTIKSATAPVFKSVGNYVSDIKNLIAKPILGALGSLAATGLATGIKTIISHIANRNKKKHIVNSVCNKKL